MSLLTPQRIGILGGGQLGAMMLRAAIDLGLNVGCMDGDPNAPCSRYTGAFTHGSLLDYDAVMAFGAPFDRLTIEIEAVNTDALAALEAQGKLVAPAPALIRTIQDKWLQKQFLLKHGIPVVPGVLLENPVVAGERSATGCLKLCRGGYDGQGVMMIRKPADWEKAYEAQSVLEELVDIDKEIAIIVARNEHGQIQVYDPVEMVADPVRHLLDYQLAPARIEQKHAVEAADLALKIAEAAQLVGILAIECFITTGGKLLVNEMAPRAHNSGHHTMDATPCGQFEQLLRCVAGLPLGYATTLEQSALVNILAPIPENLGRLAQGLNKILEQPDARIHWYGKEANRPGRKLGHVSILGQDGADLLQRAAYIRSLVRFD